MLRRWTSREPSGFDSESHDLYPYCDTDPMNRVDVDGTFGESISRHVENVQDKVFSITIMS